MDWIIGLAAGAFLVWLFLRENTRRGERTVRAYLYLMAIKEGKSTQEANQHAVESAAKPTNRQIQLTMKYLQDHHGGKQNPMLKEAEKQGWDGQ